MSILDVIVIGAGPAGLALTTALAQAGLKVAGLAPAPPLSPWQPTYGIWVDELQPDLHDTLGPRWPDVHVWAGGKGLPLQREYALFDNQRLQSTLVERGLQAGAEWYIGKAFGVSSGTRTTTLNMKPGSMMTARLVVDASGHTPTLIKRPSGGPPVAYQAAYGVVAHFEQPPLPDGQMLLMDYRADHIDRADHVDRADHLPAAERIPATFLYAMPLGDERYFVEETSLAAAPAMPIEQLKQRLHARLAAYGWRIRETLHTERVLFPMNLPLPDRRQALLGYGGAASMVHPASGYQVGAALRRAPELAQALALAMGNANARPAALARQGWRTLWPLERRRNRYLYHFGLQSLLRFDADVLSDFFATFFQLPAPLWQGYLSDRLSTRQVLQTMRSLFQQASPQVRRALIGSVGEVRRL